MTPRPGLAAARKRAGFNQEALAEEVDVTKHTVSQWETGATGISARRRPAIAAALGISLTELDRLIGGEPLKPAAEFAPLDRETDWLIDAGHLPRRPYAALPRPAAGLTHSRRRNGLSRARRAIGRLAAIMRFPAGPRS